MFNLFGLSPQIKYSALIGASALFLFGIGYIINSSTRLIDEITEEEKEIDPEEVLVSIGGTDDVKQVV